MNSFHAIDLLLRNRAMFIIAFDLSICLVWWTLRIKSPNSLNNECIETLRSSDLFKVMKLMNIRVGIRMTVTCECFSISSWRSPSVLYPGLLSVCPTPQPAFPYNSLWGGRVSVMPSVCDHLFPNVLLQIVKGAWRPRPVTSRKGPSHKIPQRAMPWISLVKTMDEVWAHLPGQPIQLSLSTTVDGFHSPLASLCAGSVHWVHCAVGGAPVLHANNTCFPLCGTDN